MKKVNKNVCGGCHKYIKKLRNDMVQCDACNQWWHFLCAEVQPEKAEDIDFLCPTGNCS